MMVRSDFGAPQSAKETLSLIGASIGRRIRFRVVDALRQIFRVQRIPTTCLVRVHDAACLHAV